MKSFTTGYVALNKFRLKQDGVYRVLANTTSGYVRTYCHMSGLSGCKEGGWTMVMKIDGSKVSDRQVSSSNLI